MDGLVKFLSTPIVLNKDNKPVVTVGTFVTMGLGAAVLYFSINERKRKNLF